jgi:beta-glucosidase/6-phospho-beta-glucosidase/beta-galactosidase
VFDQLGIYNNNNNLVNKRFFDGIKTGRIYPPVAFGEKIPYLKGSMDFVDYNYYVRNFTKGLKSVDRNRMSPDSFYPGEGFYYPEGIYKIAKTLFSKMDMPIIITENATPTDDESFRIKYMKDHITQVHRAIEDGIPIMGYLTWSLLDNF